MTTSTEPTLPTPARVSPTLERVRAALAGVPFSEVSARDGMPAIECAPSDLARVFPSLCAAGFETVTLVTAVDHLPREPRFEVLWQLLSFTHNDRLRIAARVAAADPRVPTCTATWPGASFSERECFDMFGIRFDGHPDLRRLLMPDEYTHHPLRKDFPHEGLEPDRLYREWDRRRRAAQEGL